MLKFFTFALFLLLSVATVAQPLEKEETVSLQEVIVTATRAPKNLKNVPITVQVITADDIRKSQATSFQTFLETEMAGINFTYEGGMPNINMLGFSGKYVLFLIDGERMAGETFDNIDYDRIDLENIERIEIIKGAASSLYGSNALGGVLNIITKKAQKPLEGSLSYQYNTSKNHKSNLSVGTKQKWGNLKMNAFYNFREPYWLNDREPLRTYNNGTITEAPKGSLNVAGFTNYGLTPKLFFQLTPKTDLSITPNYYFSERNSGTLDADRVRDRYYNYTLQAKTNIALNEQQQLSISGAFDRYEKFNYFRWLNQREKNYHNQLLRAGMQYNLSLWGKHQMVAGAEVLQDELLSFRFNHTGTQAEKSSQTYTVFAQQDWVVAPDLTLVTGLRMDYHSLFKTHFTYRVSAMYQVAHFTFRGGYATGFRSPTLKELFTNWFHPWGGGFQIMGNPNLKPESSDNINFSVDYNTSRWNLTAMTQFSQVKNKIDNLWVSTKDTIHYTNFKENSKIISSEFSATYRPIPALRFKGSYAYYHIGKQRSEKRPHTLTFKAEYLPKTSVRYVPSVMLTGKYQSATTIYEENGAYTRYEPYSIWRLQCTSALPYHLSLSAGIDNLLDYVTPTTSFYASTTPGRTYFVGLKWSY